jgi:hypothetical protein
MKKMTRMESSKEVRRVLNRNGVDLSYCQYSVAGYEIRLTGWLCKTDGSDFIAPQIESMIYDFKKSLQGFMIFGDTENWNFTSEFISFVGEREHQGGGGEIEQTVYEIDLDDYDFEAS